MSDHDGVEQVITMAWRAQQTHSQATAGHMMSRTQECRRPRLHRFEKVTA
jgi:hypothetical protein